MILDIGALSDLNRVHVSPNDDLKPNRALRTNRHFADHISGGRDKHVGRDPGSSSVVR
jgi:hypothetical protein